MPSSWPPSDDASLFEGRTGAHPVASGESLNSETRIVGREEELARIDELLADAAAGQSRTLLIEGEPGVGKTSLLAAARERAGGFTPVSVHGVESESVLAHAGLLGLLAPLRDLLADLPVQYAEALSGALGWSDEPTHADRFLVGAATLSLLAAAAEHRPVLVVVDDLQWLDPESTAALLFAARRLGSDAVAVILAVRAGRRPEPLADVPVLRLGGLETQAARTLLPEVAPAVVDRLIAGTDGNPLALLEVSRQLDQAQRRGVAPLPEPLPSTERLTELFRTAVSTLSTEAADIVLLLALDDSTSTGNAAVVAAAGGSDVDPGPALEEACERTVLVHDGTEFAFRHPLLRSVVLELASVGRQRAAHRALADVASLDGRARLWHRAHASLGVDPALADELSAMATNDRERQGYAAAAAALQRAADLSPDAATATERLAMAAHDAFVAGDVTLVRALTSRVLDAAAPERIRGDVLLILGMLEQYAGSVPRSVDYLSEAADLLDGSARVRALTELALACFRISDFERLARCGALIDAEADGADPEQQLLGHFTNGVALMLSGDAERGWLRLSEVRRLADEPALRHDPRALLLMALAAGFTGQVTDAVAVGAGRLDEVRRRGAIGVLVPTLTLLAAGRAWIGDHPGAFADAGEAAEFAELLGYAADASTAVEMLAWQLSARGMHDEATAALERARSLVERAEVGRFAAHHSLTAAYCALCRGDLAEVVRLLEERLEIDGGLGSAGEPLGIAPLLVEAYLGQGRGGDARDLATRFAEATPAGSQPLALALVERCRAIAAEDTATAETAFAASLEAHAAGMDPFELARTRLLYGARLRRAGQRVSARKLLTTARDGFVAMELTHWAGVAADELAASGATRRTAPNTEAALTSQETRVALLAAQGLSNKEIGASLFLSPKTIERHLGNVFRKRGFRSRTELAASFAHSLPDD